MTKIYQYVVEAKNKKITTDTRKEAREVLKLFKAEGFKDSKTVLS